MIKGNSTRLDIKNKVLSFIKEAELLTDIDTIVVGLSGGPDSTMLLVLLRDIFSHVEAVHLHHGLRGKEADHDQRWCRSLCRRLNVSYKSSNLDVFVNRFKGESTEIASRRLRLEFWTSLLANQPGKALALGHHLDDKIENFFIRLFRGSNSTGLTGLRAKAIINDVKIVRPLLCLEKKEIIHFLHECPIRDYCLDKSNVDQRIFRNKIRHKLIPQVIDILGSKQGIAKSLNFIEQDAITLEKMVKESIDCLAAEKLPTATFLKIEPSLWSRFLREWIQVKCGKNNPIRGSILKNLQRNLNHPHSNSKRFEINDEQFLLVSPDEVSIEGKYLPSFSDEIKWEWKKISNLTISEINIELKASIVNYSDYLNKHSERNSEYWDPDDLGDCLMIRPRRPADRMIPFGVKHSVKVKKIISNAKLTAAQKRRLMVISNMNGEIVWIPFVRRADLGKVDQTNRSCVKLSVRSI